MFSRNTGRIFPISKNTQIVRALYGVVLALNLSSLVHADIAAEFRRTHSGEGVVIAVKDNSRILVDIAGQVDTTNRIVAIIRTNPDLYVASGRLLSGEETVRGTQRVERIGGSLPVRVGDKVFFAPIKQEVGVVESGSLKSGDMPPEEKVISTATLPPNVQPPVSVIIESHLRQDYAAWRRELFSADGDSLVALWLSRLEQAIQSWEPGNDHRVGICVRHLERLGATNQTAYLLLMYEYHVKANAHGKAVNTLEVLRARVPEIHLERLRSMLPSSVAEP